MRAATSRCFRAFYRNDLNPHKAPASEAPPRRRGSAIPTAAFLALSAMACDMNNPTYRSAQDPIEVGGTDPATGMGRPAAGSARVQIRFRAPSADDQAKLSSQSAGYGFQVPWIKRSDVAIEVLYTVTNLDKKPGQAQVLLTGADEFTNYDTADVRAALEGGGEIVIGNEDVIVLPLINHVLQSQVLPGESVRGNFREDEIAEAELDLDAMGRWMAVPASVLINRSEVNPIGLEMMPENEIVPAFQWVAVTFKANVHMKCEFLLRVRDGAGRLYGSDDTLWDPMPTDYAFAGYAGP